MLAIQQAVDHFGAIPVTEFQQCPERGIQPALPVGMLGEPRKAFVPVTARLRPVAPSLCQFGKAAEGDHISRIRFEEVMQGDFRIRKASRPPRGIGCRIEPRQVIRVIRKCCKALLPEPSRIGPLALRCCDPCL